MKKIGEIIGILCCIVFILYSSVKMSKAQHMADVKRNMDGIEKHYDADGPLVMIDIENNMVGFYYCATPLQYYTCEINYNKADIGTIILVSNEVRYVSDKTEFVFPFTEDQLTWIYENIPNETPVVMY